MNTTRFSLISGVFLVGFASVARPQDPVPSVPIDANAELKPEPDRAVDFIGVFAFWPEQPGPKPTRTPSTKMRISGLKTGEFLVEGIDKKWKGIGRFKDAKGYYSWKFTDDARPSLRGETGSTAIKLNKDGTITARIKSKSGNIKWTYRGWRITQKTGAVALPRNC